MDTALIGEQLVNSFTENSQNNVRSVTLIDGSYVLVWQSVGQDGDSSGVVARRFDAGGAPLGPEILVNTTTRNDQSLPDVAATADGGYVVVWQSRDQVNPADNTFDIIAQRFTVDGDRLGGETVVNDGINVSEGEPSVTGFVDGGYVVTWSENSAIDGSGQSIVSQRFDATGAKVGGETVVNVDNFLSTQSQPETAALVDALGDNAGHVVVFTSNTSGTTGDGSSNGIFARVFDAAGVALGPDFQVNTTTAQSQADPEVAGLVGGGFVVVWDDSFNADGSGFGVFGQVFDNTGTPVGSEFQVNVETSSSQFDPSVTGTSDGGFVVTWTSVSSGGAGDGSGTGVFGRRFDATGLATSGEILINEETSSTQEKSTVTALADGAFAVGWVSTTSGSAGDGDLDGVFQRVFGDPVLVAAPSANPGLEAISDSRSFTEAEAAAGQLLDLDGAAAVSDPDSVDFDGGRLTVSLLSKTELNDGFGIQDAGGQDEFGLHTGARVSVFGADVSVDGTLIGTIVSDGTGGAPLIVEFNASSTAGLIEVLVENLTYRNVSDDPDGERSVQVHLSDGDGGGSETQVVDISITPEVDIDGFARRETQVNTQFINDQTNPSVATLTDGGWIVVWTSQNQDGSGSGVFAQRYDANGIAVGDEFQVNQTTSSTQIDASVAALNDGGFVIAWEGNGPGDGAGVFLNRYDLAGTLVPAETEVRVNTETSGSQFDPEVVGLTDGGYTVTWVSNTSGAAGDGSSQGVFTQRYTNTGAPVGGETLVNEQIDGAQNDPEMAALAGGRAIIVWTSDTNGLAGDGSEDGIFARFIDQFGVVDGPEFQVNSSTLNNQTQPVVAELANGEIVVAWTSSEQDGSGNGVFYQRFTSAGVPVGEEVRVNDETSGAQDRPAVAALDDGRFVISWDSANSGTAGDGSFDGLFAQVFDADGTRLDSKFQVNTESGGNQGFSQIAALPGGNLVVVYESNLTSFVGPGGDGDRTGIFQQIIADPASFLVSDEPVLEGVEQTFSIAEGAAQAGAEVFPGGLVHLTDPDSTDFAGGELRIRLLNSDANAEDYLPPDDTSQDNLSFAGPRIGIVGSDLLVDGIVVGLITADGSAGGELRVTFNPLATVERVEAVVAALTYQNPSDNPRTDRTYLLTLDDGDGGFTENLPFTISLTQEAEAVAPEPVGGEQQVNAFTPNDQTDSEVAVLGDGGWVVVWTSSTQGGIHQQHYSADGDRIGPETQVNTGDTTAAADAVVTGLADGGWVVIWEETNAILGQRYDAAGLPAGAEFVVDDTTGSVRDAAVSSFDLADGGGFVVAYSGSGPGDSSGVFFRRFDAAGTPLDVTDQRVNTETSSTQDEADVTVLSDGRFAVTWTSVASGTAGDGSSDGVFVRIFNTDGTPATGELPVNQLTNSSQNDSAIAALPGGGFVVVWEDNSGQDGSAAGVAARFFDGTGLPTSDQFIVNEERSSTQNQPDVQVLSDGNILVTWTSANSGTAGDGSGAGVFGQILSAAGARIDGEFQINTEFSSTQNNSSAAALPGGNFVVTWDSTTSGSAGDGSFDGVFQQIFGDPAAFSPGAAPILQGVPKAATLNEADLNAGLTLIDPDRTIALGDAGVSGFDGGVLTLRIDDPNPLTDQFPGPDGNSQDMLGIVPGDNGNGAVTVAGPAVSVDGVVIGTITSDGQGGSPFVLTLNASATVEAVEAVLGQIGYANVSDDPVDARRIALDLTDGDGLSAPTEFIDLSIVPQTDNALVAQTEQRVNAHGDHSQFDPQIVELTGGGFVVVWTSTNQDDRGTFDNGVYGQLYAADGAPVGQEFQVNTTTSLTQERPVIAATADGGFVVAWQGDSQDEPGIFDLGIIAQRFDAAGAKVGGEFIVNDDGDPLTNADVDNSQFEPDIAAFADGGFIAVWRSDQGDGSGDSIISQRFDAAGAHVGGQTVVNVVNTSSTQFDPSVATLVTDTGTNAGHVVVFTSVSSGATGDGSSNGVFARIFDAVGVPIGNDFLVNTNTSSDQQEPSVVGLNGGGFVVVWSDQSSLDGSGTGVFAQLYQNDGTPVGLEFRVNDFTSGTQSEPDVAALADGGFQVTWTDNNGLDGSSTAVITQRYTATGERVDGQQIVNQVSSSSQLDSSVAALSTGGFAAVYENNASGAAGGDGSSTGVFLRVFEDPANIRQTSPILRDLDFGVTLNVADVNASLTVLDNAIQLDDPDGGNFAGGRIEIYYTSNGQPDDILGIAGTGLVSVNGVTGVVSVNGTVVGTIADDGTAGQQLSVDLNASADAAAVRAILEQVAFSSPTALSGEQRGIGFLVSDGVGGQTEPDSILLTIGSASGSGLRLTDVGVAERGQPLSVGPYDEDALQAAPVVIDAAVDFEDFVGTGFDGGFVRLHYNTALTSRIGSFAEQLSIQDVGTGAGQIGFDGTTVTFGGVPIGTINGTADGVDGNELQIDLNAAATADAVDALIENFTFAIDHEGPAANRSMFFQVSNGSASTSSSSFTLNISQTDESPVPTGGEEQVNTFITSTQQAPRIDKLDDGGYIVTWISSFQDEPGSSNRGIFAQRYNEAGQAVGPEFQVNDIAVGDQIQARAGGLSNGNFVILWTEASARDGSGQGVFGQLFDPDSNPIGSAFQVNDEFSSTQNQSELAPLTGGGFMAIWTSAQSGTAGDGSSNGIFARVFDASGAPTAGEFQVNTSVSGNQNRPAITTLSGGDALAVWEDNQNGDIRMQRVDATGQLVSIDGLTLGADEQAVSASTTGQDQPAVIAFDGGGWVVVWTENDGHSDGVFGQIFAADGAAVGVAFQVSDTIVNTQSDPAVAAIPGGGFVVVWTDDSGTDGSGNGVFGQAYDATGQRIDRQFQINEEFSSSQFQPDVTVLNNGTIAVTWASDTSGTAGDGNGRGVFQRLFDAPPLPAGAASPTIEGFDEQVTLDAVAVNAGLVLLNQDGALALTDMDSPDFDGGSLILQRQTTTSAQLNALNAADQEQLGVLDGNGVSVDPVTGVVTVDGVTVGTIDATDNGVDGSPLRIDFAPGATVPRVEKVIERLAFSTPSTDPILSRDLVLQVSDGDGGSSGPQIVTVDLINTLVRPQTPFGDEEQVNTFTPGAQTNSEVATTFDPVTGQPNGYVVVWQSSNQDRFQADEPGIFGQRYDLDGQPIGGEFQVNSFTEFTQSVPDVIGLAGGGFVVSWTSDSFADPVALAAGDTSSNATIGQIFDADGNPLGGNILLNDGSTTSESAVRLAALSNGGFAATYDDPGLDSSGGIGVQIFDATGNLVATEFAANTFTPNVQFDSSVAGLAAGDRFVVVWTSRNQDVPGTNADGVFGQLFSNAGVPIGTEFQVNTTTAGEQENAEVAALTNGDFVVVWEDSNATDGSSTGVFQQRYANDGRPIGAQTLVNELTNSSQFDPSIVGLSDGGWVVTWTDNSGIDGSGQGIFAQVYAADGSRVDGQFQVNTEFSSTQNLSSVAALDGAGFIVAYSSATSGTAGDGSSTGVFQQVFKTGGGTPSADPGIVGLSQTVGMNESDFADFVALDPAVALGDTDSANFNGGELRLTNVANDLVQPQFSGQDDGTQDQFGLVTGGHATLSAGVVSVDGVAIGTLVEDGADGADFAVSLNADATPDRVELLVESLGYRNASDDPLPQRLVALQIQDGAGGVLRETITIDIAPEIDGVEIIGGERQVNSFTTGNQFDPDIADLSGGGFVAVWTSVNQDATGDNSAGVFAQRFDASGAAIGGEFQVNTTTISDQREAKVVGLATGGFAVVWENNSPANVAFQVYDASGAAVGGESVIDSPNFFEETEPQIAAFSNGDFAISFDGRNSSTFVNQIGVQRFNDGGAPVGSETVISDPLSNSFSQSAIAVLSDGTSVVSFTAPSLDGSFNGIFHQRFAADGSVIGAPVQVNTAVFGSQSDSSVAAIAGGYVVVWTSDRGDDFSFTGSSFGVYGQRFDLAGNPVGREFLVNEIVDNTQSDAEVVGLSNGGFAVTFSDSNGTDGSGVGVFVQQYNALGNRVDGQLQVNEQTSSTQEAPAIAALPNGAFVVAWDSITSGTAGDGSSDGVFLRILGDPADFSTGGEPVLDGINVQVTYVEDTVNAVPQLIDANGAAAVSDSDSADFDGGSILVSNVIASAPLIDQINPPDDLTQDVLGLRQTDRISIVGNDVSVDGTLVGTIVQNGLGGAPFEILMNVNSNPEIAELLVENLTYRNLSDDPIETRLLRVQLTDGDGGVSEPQLVEVTILPSIDAATPRGGERQANTETSSTQDEPAVTTLANGDFVITWTSTTSGTAGDGSGEGVFAQRFDAIGNPVARDGTALASGATDEFQVNSQTNSGQFDSAIAALDDGGFLVTWTSQNNAPAGDGSGNGVFGQRYDANGVAVDLDGVTPSVAGSGEFQVNVLTSSTQNESDVAGLLGPNSGGWVSVWTSITSGGAGDGNSEGVIGRIYNASGVPGSEFVINTEILSEQDTPAVTALSDGGFFVTWRSVSTTFDPAIGTIPATADGDRSGVFGQRFDAAGAPVGTEVQINSFAENHQFEPRVEVLDNGNLAVVWTDSIQDQSGSGIFATILDGTTGAPVVSEFRVNDQRISTQEQPDVAALDNGGFVVVWNDGNFTDGSSDGIFAQQYDANGARLDSQFQVNTETSADQFDPAVSALPGGGFVVAWTSDTSGTAGDGSGRGIFYQVYGNDAPSVSPVSADGFEDTPLVLDAAFFDAGFNDPEGQTLQAVRVDLLPSPGSLTLSGSPVLPGQEISRADLLADNLVYTGFQDFNGVDSFLWTGSDGTSFSTDIVQATLNIAPVNDAPGLEAGADATVGEGQFFSRSLVLTDPDPDTRTISVDFDGDGVPDQVFDSGSNTPSISNTFTTEGVFTVTVTVDDNAGAANSVEVDTFTVTVQNAAPNAINDFRTISEDGPPEDINVLGNDSDPGGDPISILDIAGGGNTVGSPITLPSGAIVTLNADGTIAYDPNGQFEGLADFQNGSDSFTYTIQDDAGLTDTATVFVTIDGQNDAPDAVDDAIVANNDSAITGNVLNDNGLGADFDVDAANTLTVTAVNGVAADIGSQITLPSGARLTLNSNGTFNYDPTGAFPLAGVDSFTYDISDGRGGTDTATVNITVNNVNDAPVAHPDTFTTDEETTLTGGNVLADNGAGPDSDADGDTLTVTQVNGSVSDVGSLITLSSGARLTLNSDGTFTYDPNGQFESLGVGDTGIDSFTYTIEDGNGGSDSETVTINISGVNDPPDAVGDSASTDEKTAVAGNVLTNDTDIDGGALSVTEVNGSALAINTQTTLPSGALITLNADGTFTYDPNGQFISLGVGQNGSDSLTYTISDGNGGTDIATLSLTISGVNDGPTAADDDVTASEDLALNGNVLADNGNGADSDPDNGDTLTVTAVNGNPASVGSPVTLLSGALLTLNASGTFVYDANGQFEFLNSGEIASDSFTYTIEDASGVASSATVNVTIQGNGDAPVAQDDSFTTNEDTSVSGSVLVDNGAGADFDPDGDALTVSAVNGAAADVGVPLTLPSGALLTLNANGTFSYDPNGQFESLAVGAIGVDSFTYEIADGNGGFATATVTVNLDGVNDPPVAQPDTIGTDENTAVVDNVLDNNGFGADSDIDGDPLTVTEINGAAADVGVQVTLASGALVTLDANGDVAYNPNGQFEGLGVGEQTSDSFTYTISDGNGGTDTATTTFLISGVNDGPDAVDDGFSTPINVGLSGQVLNDNGGGPDSDPDVNDVLSLIAVNGLAANLGSPITLTSGATLTVNADGTFDYDPTTSSSLVPTDVDTFTYTISDGKGGTDTATVSITLDPFSGNLPPVAADDSGAGFSTDEDTAFTTANVLPNDSDPNAGDVLSVQSIDTTGTLGTVTDNLDGTFDYNPNGQFESLAVGESATDTFTYTVSDGNGGTDTATVSILVNGVNDAPDAVDDDRTTDEDTPLTISGLLGNDSDPDTSDTLSIASFDTTGTLGTVTDNLDGTFSYDPTGQFESLAVGESATDTFTYTVSDGNGGTDTATVSVRVDGVNDAPDAVDDDRTTDEDTPLTISGLLGNDSDPDTSDTLSIASIDTTGTLGTVTDNLDGTFSYDPTAAFNFLAVGESATDTFTYTVSDGNGGTDTATVSILVNGVNDAPDAVDDDRTTDEDTPLTISGLLGNDSDPDTSDTLSIASIDTTGTLGTVTDNLDGTFSYDPTAAFNFLAVGESATDTFTYTVSDGNGGTDTATVSILVNGVNDAPDAVDDDRTTDEDTPLTISGLLGNDSDPDTSDTLSIASIDTTGTLGTVTDNLDGTFSYDPTAAFNFLAVGESATDTFTYTVSDGNGGTDTATVSILVNGVNDAPDAVDDDRTTDEDTPLTISGLLGNDSDPDTSDTLSIASIDTTGTLGTVTDNLDGTFSYDPTAAFNFLAVGESATDTFTYTVSDGNGGTDTATVSILVNGVNDAPDAVDDDRTTDEDTPLTISGLLGNDSDPDTSDTLSIASFDTTGTLGTVTDNLDGTFSYDPTGQFESLAVGESATDTFTYTVSDGNGGTDTATVSVRVDGVNDAPDAVDDDRTTDEDTPLTISGLLGNDSDPDTSDTLSIASIDTTGTLGTVTDNLDGTFSYDPTAAFNFLAVGESATDTFTYTVSDGNGGTDTATVSILVNGANDAPDALDDDFVTDEETVLSGNVLDDNGNGSDNDPDTTDGRTVTAVNGTPLGAGAITLVSGALLTMNAAGAFDYDPNGQFDSLAVGETATDSFTYTISDGNGGTDTATVTVSINGVNDAPVAVDDIGTGFETDENTSFTTVSVLGNDNDPDTSDTPTVQSIDTTGTAGTVTDNTNGTFNYDPNGQFDFLAGGEVASDTFNYTISDGIGGFDTATVTVTIEGVNDAPEFLSDAQFAIDENLTDVGLVVAADVDISDVLTYSIEGGVDGTLFDIDAGTGALSFLSAPDFEAPLDSNADNIYALTVGVFDGTDLVTQDIEVSVNDVDEGGSGPNLVEGTAGSDVLIGTAGEDIIVGNGGAFDFMSGGAGADIFVFSSTAGGAGREIGNIADYTPGEDLIDLAGSTVSFDFSTGSTTYLFLDGGDFDTLIVNGAATLGDIDFV
ncbi:Ig-like domain-containing protein [Hwanghaeella sp.]|uniref:Ig-like domain-containing protein n=1 Tax=Hwanghaeella sp. TaxID=2605943 RepID=UPI003CCBC73C